MAGAKTDQRKNAELIRQLVESGALKTVIDQSFPLEEIAEAHRLAEGGHKRGHAVVLMDQAPARITQS